MISTPIHNITTTQTAIYLGLIWIHNTRTYVHAYVMVNDSKTLVRIIIKIV